MQQLSLRKYAATIGVSHTAVAKAVKAGYINKGWDPEQKKIIVDVANKEWGNEVRQKISSQANEANDAPANFGHTHLTEQDYTPTSEEMTLSEARRRKEIYNAEIARIAALKEQGLYVEKEKVYKELFDFGKTLRVDLQAIPDRYIDNILSAKTRFESHSILLNAINDTLQRLAEVPEIK